jgi:hypothetical protein
MRAFIAVSKFYTGYFGVSFPVQTCRSKQVIVNLAFLFSHMDGDIPQIYSAQISTKKQKFTPTKHSNYRQN